MERTGRTGLAPIALALALLPGIARAETFVVAPLNCSDAEASANVTSLVSAELDFQPTVDAVKEIKTEPSGSSCLSSSSCLGALLRAGGGDKLITGTLVTSSSVYKLDMVVFDGSRVIQRKQYELPASPTEVADGMTGVVRDLLSGTSAAPEPVEEPSYSFGGEDDDVQVATQTPAERTAAQKAEAKRLAEAEAARRAEEERRAEEDRKRREEESRETAAEEEARKASEQAALEEAARRESSRRAALAAAAAGEFDPNAITFASATTEMKIESAEDIQFARPTEVDIGGRTATLEAEPDPAEDTVRHARSTPEDLDGTPPEPRGSSKPPKDDRPKPERDVRHAVGVVARGGYSRYFQLGFITYGAELSVPLGQTGVYAIGGMEAYSVNRTLPTELQDQLGRTHAWDTIFPFNLGIAYKIVGGRFVPFFGADAIFGQYYVDPETNAASWTFGARGRLGLDIYFTKVFGIDFNVSAGFWTGDQWEIIDQGMKNIGFLPQASAGAAFRF